jgi:hypothetical protein
MGLRRPQKWPELARALAERKFLCAGISETWMTGTGRQEPAGKSPMVLNPCQHFGNLNSSKNYNVLHNFKIMLSTNLNSEN